MHRAYGPFLAGFLLWLPYPAVAQEAAGLPNWLRLGAEFRGRGEFALNRSQDVDDRLYLNRLRVSASVAPAGWAKFFFEGQDARAFRLDGGSAPTDRRNTFELRQGYAELGNAEQGFLLRVGRQSLAVADERLLAADSFWDPFGLTFDALYAGFATARFKVDAFAGMRVTPGARRPDGFDTASRMAGMSAQFKVGGTAVVKPYLLWKRGGEAFDLMDNAGHRDVVAPGVSAQGELPRNADFNVEMALERGHVVGDAMSAWGGHWEIGWKPLGKDVGPRVSAEYNYASGDRDPADGRHGTFDDMYPAGFNKYGITDPFAWRNIRYPAFGVEMPLSKRWTVAGGWRAYWLTTVRDGLYPGGDAYLFRNPQATSGHIGNQAFVSATYTRSPRWRVLAGYGHLSPGAYLRQQSYPAPLKTFHLTTHLTI